MPKTNNKLTIGNKLESIREKNRLSLEVVAHYLGISSDLLNAIEMNKDRVSTVLLERICELYGCSSRDLLEQDIPQTIEYTHPLSDYIDDLPGIASINRIAINLLEIQRIMIIGEKFQKIHEKNGEELGEFKNN